MDNIEKCYKKKKLVLEFFLFLITYLTIESLKKMFSSCIQILRI